MPDAAFKTATIENGHWVSNKNESASAKLALEVRIAGNVHGLVLECSSLMSKNNRHDASPFFNGVTDTR
jgi:hypothetical protein